ncbi:MAG: hypothetical protein IPF48_07720 [Sphingomonadales bacterium]|nr:hypothetical protein [Sphingomonadales bacterium]MBK6491893.1 hypothetical protein [Sphingomonadales bacterium]MBK6718695.1 hypothetical protein [Sphingomonadales bacterium]MBK8272287.1 hypothetical protein [Sphingomonadales bacterium]MBK8862169.1 hypothetical protein [Sphingomonadales bacterium]
MTDYMVTGLLKKRAAIAGEIKHHQESLARCAADLETLDATLRIVAPHLDIQPIAPKTFKPPAHWSKRGEMSRVVLDILRVARSPYTSRDIAAQMIVQRGMVATPQLLNVMSKRVATALRGLRDKGTVRNAGSPQAFWLEWEIIR